MISPKKVGKIIRRTNSMRQFPEILHELRLEKKLALQKLGDYIGVSDTAIMKWESGKAEPKLSYIIALCSFFDVSADYLLGLKDF